MSNEINLIQGQLSPSSSKGKFVIVASRFNDWVVSRLVSGAVDALRRHGIKSSQIEVVQVPGAWEIPLACQAVAKRKQVDAVIALAAVVRGATPHFDYVAAEVSKGCAQVMLNHQKPVTFGVLTTDNLEQAVERAGAKHGNKGADAALAALETVNLLNAMGRE